MAMLNKEKLELLKIAKGYRIGEPALIAFDTLVKLIETKDNALDEIQKQKEKNQKLLNQLKMERIANAAKERDYLNELRKLENQIDKSNVAASTFLAATMENKRRRMKELQKIEKKKIFSKTDLMLGAYYE